MDDPTQTDDIEDLRGSLQNARHERLADTRRRARLYTDELLTCALTIAELEGPGPGNELDIALEMIRSRAEEVGLLRRRPPRPV